MILKQKIIRMSNKKLYYCIEWPEAEKYQDNDECYLAYDGFNLLVFVPKDLYEKNQVS